jgi:hypothetical protein
MQFGGPVQLPADPATALQAVTRQYVDAQAKTFLPVANGTHFNGNGGATATAGLIQTRCRQTRKLLRVIASGADTLQVEWANIWTSNTPQAGNASCEIAGQQSVTARMTIEYPAGNPRLVSSSTAYASGTAYALLDQVTSGGSSWVCIQAGTGQTPATGSAYWRQVNRYVVNWDTQTDTSGTVVFAAGDYRKSRPIPLLEKTRQGDCIAILGGFDTGSATGYLPYAGASGASNTAPFVDWVLDSTSTSLPAVGSALCDTGVTTQTNGNTTTANSTTASSWMKIPFATAITGNIPTKRCVALFGDSLVQGTGGDCRDGEPAGIFPRSVDGHSWWRIAQGGNRAGCYVPDNAPWQMSVVARCSGVITNLAMNDINANLTVAQVKSAMQTMWTMLGATGTPVYSGYPTPLSASSDAWATTANQSRFTNAGAVNTTQNPTDDASYLTSVYGQISMWLSQSGASITIPDGSTAKVGQRGHPLDGLVDWRALIADPQTSWKWNPGAGATIYTADGAHPNTFSATVQAVYTAQQLEPVIYGRQMMPIAMPSYRPVGEPPVQSMPRVLATSGSPSLTNAGTMWTVLDVSPGRYYYGFRFATGSFTGTAPARQWTVLAGADPAKLGVVSSGTTFGWRSGDPTSATAVVVGSSGTSPIASALIDTGLSGAPVWIPAGYVVVLAVSYPASAVASLFVGATEVINYQGRTGLGFCLSGFSGDTAVISAQASNLFENVNNTAPGAGVIVPWRFRIWAELY